MEERLGRLYLQLLDAERRALEAAYEARVARRDQGGEAAAAAAPAPQPQPQQQQQQQQPRAPSAPASPAPGGGSRSSSPLRTGALSARSSRRGARSPAAQRAADRRRAAGVLSASPASGAAPWRGARYNAWLPGSADYALTAQLGRATPRPPPPVK